MLMMRALWEMLAAGMAHLMLSAASLPTHAKSARMATRPRLDRIARALGWRSGLPLRFKRSRNPPVFAAEVPGQARAQARLNCTDTPPLSLLAHAFEGSVEYSLEMRSILLHPAPGGHRSQAAKSHGGIPILFLPEKKNRP